MSYEQLAASVDALAEANQALTSAVESSQLDITEAVESTRASAEEARLSAISAEESNGKLEQDLALPTGADKIGVYGTNSASTVSNVLSELKLTGQTEGIPHFIGQEPGKARLFLAGYDSLTAGAGGTSWNKYFRPIMRGHMGDGGPGLQLFSMEISRAEGASFGVTGLSSIVENGPYYKYSIGGFGVYSEAANGSAFLNWKPRSAWKTARVFYLKQPSGGTFRLGTNDQVDSSKILVDTSAETISLGYTDIVIGNGSAGQTLACRVATGKLCIFGALFENNATGFLFGNIAKGGRKLADVAAQDSELRRQWFSVLKPSHFILNGGANDKNTRTGLQHKQDLVAILTDVTTASPSTSVTIVQHNHIEGEADTYLPEHAVQKLVVCKMFGTGFSDNRNLLGSYSAAAAAGLMLDGVHPSDKANKPIAAFTAESLGFSGNSSDPGETPYGGGGTPIGIVRSGSLTAKGVTGTSGQKLTVYTLGLSAGYPVAMLELTVTCNRKGTILNKVKRFTISVGNSTVVNASNGVTTPQLAYSTTDTITGSGGPTSAGDFTVTAEIVSGKCVISVTPTEFESSFSIVCNFSMPYNPSRGVPIFEN